MTHLDNDCRHLFYVDKTSLPMYNINVYATIYDKKVLTTNFKKTYRFKWGQKQYNFADIRLNGEISEALFTGFMLC